MLIEHRIFGRWFFELELSPGSCFTIGFEHYPSASELLGGILAEETEEFLEEEE